MSKWNKNHGLIVPIDSLLKEKENTNRPAPLRSAGLVGRWGITSFTSIRNTSYEFESTSPKESDELSCSSNLASLSTQLPAAPKPKKFFKSRNNAPPATPDPHRQTDAAGMYHQQIVQHQAAQLQARINQKAGGSPPYVPPAAGFYTQQQSSSKSPAKEEVVKEKKKPGRKKKVKPVEVAEPPPPQPPTSEEQLPVDPEVPEAPSEETPAPTSAKKEKKEKKEKKSKKVKKEPELPPELPKRNSSRIRNKVVNYNEDDDSFDSPIPFRNVDTPPVGPSKLAAEPVLTTGEEVPTVAAQEPTPLVVPVPQPSPGKVKEPKTAAVPVPLSSPSVLEHPPIVLRISKGTSRLVSTDSEDVHSPPHGTTPNSASVTAAAAPLTPSHQSTPPPQLQHQQQTLPPPPPSPARREQPEPTSAAVVPPLIIKPPVASPPEEAAGGPRKDDLKIKISLSKSSLISSNGAGASSGTVGSGSKKKESKKELRHFKKRAIAREQKVSRASKRVRRGEEVVQEEQEEGEGEVEDEQLLAGVAEDLRVDPIVIPAPPRPSFPLPGTDAYELYRTLASPSGGDDFDSQSSILGSASSNATPKHGGIAAAEDCRIIHSRGSSDCGSDLELSQNSQNSQNSSTAAAPPSEINFESENTQELREENPVAKEEVAPPKEERVEVLKLSLKGTRATRSTRSSRMKGGQIEVMAKPEPVPVPAPEVVSPAEPPVKKFGRATRQRNNNNNVVNAATPEEKLPEVVPEPPREPSPPPVVQKTATRQYNRRKKNVIPPDYQPEVTTSPNRKQPPAIEEPPPFTLSNESAPLLASIQTTPEDLTTNSRTAPAAPEPAPQVQDENQPEPKEYKIKNKYKRIYYRSEELKQREAAQAQAQQQQQVLVESAAQNVGIPSGAGAAALTVPQISIPAAASSSQETVSSDGGPAPVKLVISKKKGSIFKSRPLVGSAEAADKKRHVYKHKWDDDDQEGKEKAALLAEKQQEKEVDTFEGEPSGLSRVPRSGTTSGAPTAFDEDDDDEFDFDAKLKCNRNAKPYYTVVRNVKKAHQIQEIGESQEMDDDVEYILSALQSDNPIATRCLSAMTLATKCMTPAFRMHVRAHGVVTRFFKALQDAHRDQSLGLCTATIMFVLSQDTLNMDLDRDSLELMLNLLDTDHHRTDAQPDPQTRGQLEKNRSKVRELCEEIKNSGKAKHMDLDAITVGSLAMESLLSLTSKRAGDWFKDELRNLGGLEHLIKTVSDCCREISDYVIEWTDELLSKLQKIERCLRVLENVTLLNEQNQSYILNYNGGSLVATLAKLFKLVDGEVVLYPTNERTPKEDRGAVLREVIPPILKIFISLTHPFNDTAYGAGVIGSQPHVIETTLHLLLRVGDYVPQKFIFEMNILVLLFLINLSMYTQANRTRLMKARAPDDYGTPEDSPRQSKDEMAVQALVEYFYRQDELARYAEKNTDAILDAKSKKNQDIEETVTKLLQKAGHHMEHTLMASYVCLLIGWLVIGSEENEATVRTYLREGNFVMMVSSLEKYYNFLNLTANSDALSLQHVRQTKNIIDNLKRLDAADRVPQPEASTSQHHQAAPVQQQQQQQPPQAPHRYGSRSSTRAHY